MARFSKPLVLLIITLCGHLAWSAPVVIQIKITGFDKKMPLDAELKIYSGEDGAAVNSRP